MKRRRWPAWIAAVTMMAALSHAWLHAAHADEQGHFAGAEQCLLSQLPVAIAPAAATLGQGPIASEAPPPRDLAVRSGGDTRLRRARGPPQT